MRKVLFCDLDDTLIYTASVYAKKKKENALRIASELDLPSDFVRDRINKTEMELIGVYGISSYRFCYSSKLTYEKLCKEKGVKPQGEISESLWKNAESVLAEKYQVIEGAIESLQKVHQMGWNIVIWTMGDYWGQLKKVLDLGIESILYDVQVLDEKNEETLDIGLSMYSSDIAAMVGNSERSDVHPALRCGIWAIHIPCKTWEYDIYEIDTKNRKYMRIDDIKELPKAIANIEVVEMEQALAI